MQKELRSLLCLVGFVESTEFAELGPGKSGEENDENGPHAACHDSKDWADQGSHRAGLKRAQFVGRADEDAIDRRHAPAYFIGGA